MDYLFFDVECAKCIKGGAGFICEFGYVITNSRFEILEQNHFMINPDHEFDKYALKKVLRYSKEEYEASPLFPEFYPKIAALLDSSKYFIVGHSTSADKKYILSECKRYGLPELNYKYFDVKYPFMHFQEKKQPSKLEKMLLELELEKPGDMHDARYDALSTMLVCKELCRRHSKTMTELFRTRKDGSTKAYSQGKNTSTLGDLLKAKGVDLQKLLEE